jgi:NhaP-type Na+/H+ or K+/H+ antiporter
VGTTRRSTSPAWWRLSYLGGIAAGALVAGAAYVLLQRLANPAATNIALLLTPFTAYLAAEIVGASGVLAVVVAGLVVAYTADRISIAASRRQTAATWSVGSALLDDALFVLTGLEVQAVVHDVSAAQVGRLLGMLSRSGSP